MYRQILKKHFVKEEIPFETSDSDTVTEEEIDEVEDNRNLSDQTKIA